MKKKIKALLQDCKFAYYSVYGKLGIIPRSALRQNKVYDKLWKIWKWAGHVAGMFGNRMMDSPSHRLTAKEGDTCTIERKTEKEMTR